MSAAPLERYRLLDAFRGLAILWLVLFHVLVSVHGEYGSVAGRLLAQGYLGVSIFFVISGYGIAASISRGGPFREPLPFLLHRLRRIYLPYWWHLPFAALVLPFLSALLSMAGGHGFAMRRLPYSAADWLQMATLTRVFSAADWKLHEAFNPLNGPLWYLAIIVQMYLFVAFCLGFRRLCFYLLAAGLAASLLTNVPSLASLVPPGVFLPFFSQFCVGMLVHVLLRRNLAPRSNLVASAIVLPSLGALYYCASTQSALLPLSFASVVGCTFLVLHEHDVRLSRFPFVRLFALFGMFSYSMYLMHFPLWRLLGPLVRNLVPLPFVLSGPLILVPGILVLSYSWYLFFERPMDRGTFPGDLLSPVCTLGRGWRLAMDQVRHGDHLPGRTMATRNDR